MRLRVRLHEVAWRRVAAVVAATVVLTAAFVGVLAVVTGNAGGWSDRLALYALCGGVAFVGVTFGLARRELDGLTVLFATVGASLLTVVVALFAGEGLRYAVRSPEEVFDLQLLAYFATAGLVVIGLTFWTLRYWRDVLLGARAGNR